ncbi:MAG: translation initiation factor IF-2 [Mycoplasmataceae bacterium]|nr:translation initiation factor IF-2 [Mycoplasmataceae bacterium]
MKDNRKNNKQAIQDQLKNVATELKDGVFIFTGPLPINDFADAIKKPANEIITHFFMEGKMFNINYVLDEDQIAELCLKYGYDFQKEDQVDAQNLMDSFELVDDEKDLTTRAPIITIMGHVDHGKTTLIDSIRGSNIAKGESGGITQHTGAYQVEHNKNMITFLDTPGHEAFTTMRSRGAQLTDIVIIVVAADDGVMPQTKEAIQHAKAAGVPMIVFVNKMDKHGIDIERVKAELSKEDIVSEEWGGSVQFIYGSALKNEGVKDLFTAIILESEMLELRTNKNRMPIGVVVESFIDKGRGTVSTLIVQHGTIHARDFIVAGSKYGRIRTLQDTNGKTITEALPGTPIVITGLNYVPQPGDKFFGFNDEKFAKKLAKEKEQADKKETLRSKKLFTIEDGQKVLNIIVKTDVQGTAEAVKYSLLKLETEEVKIRIVSSSVGLISKTDISLASASDAHIYSFNISPSAEIKKLARESGVDIKTFSIIYKMIEEIDGIIKGMKTPVFEEKYIGRAQVLQTFFYSKVGTIAGSIVEDGYIESTSKIKVKRGDKIIYEGVLDSLQRGPDQLKKAENGKDFGCHVKGFDDVKQGDFIEAYADVEIKD